MVLFSCSAIACDNWDSQSGLCSTRCQALDHSRSQPTYFRWTKLTLLLLHEDLFIRKVYEYLNQRGKSANKKNFPVVYPQNFLEKKKSVAKFPPRNFLQQRILQARGHSTGTITSQALPTLRAVPGKLLVLSRAQHPFQLQDKQDHRHSALMCWKPRGKKTTHKVS